MVSSTTRIEEHPDLIGLRMRYEQVAETRTARVVGGLSFLTGLFIALAPWIAGFAAFSTLAVSNLVVGIAAALLAVGFSSAFGRTHGIGWVAPLLGVWTIVSPWVVSGAVHSTRSVLSNVIAGGLFTLFSLAAVTMGARRAGERTR